MANVLNVRSGVLSYLVSELCRSSGGLGFRSTQKSEPSDHGVQPSRMYKSRMVARLVKRHPNTGGLDMRHVVQQARAPPAVALEDAQVEHGNLAPADLVDLQDEKLAPFRQHLQ